jgi:type IV pilus assembly protein PilE
MSTINKKAFTLIELLVVVLIIGILAAIALPQYQKSVEKARAAEALSIMKTIKQAEEMYYLIYSEYTMDFNKLDISIPGNNVSSSQIDGKYFAYVLVNKSAANKFDNVYLDAYRINSSYGYWFDYIFDKSNYQGYLKGGKLYCSAREAKDVAICEMLGTYYTGTSEKRYEL